MIWAHELAPGVRCVGGFAWLVAALGACVMSPLVEVR
jgi:hypothetical protein